MKIKLPISKLVFHLLIIANLFFVYTTYSQSLGDYKSIGSGNWTDLASWEYWDGDSWETPSGVSPYGYPGQYPGTGAVLIQEGHTLTIGTSGITTQLMGTLTIDGSLVLTGTPPQVGGVNFNFNTSSIIVTPLKGVIYFIDKANLILPENATLQVTSYPNPNPTYKGLLGDCSAQQSIVIGALDYAVCKGNTADTGLTFSDIMNAGGTLNAIINATPPVVCQGGSINLVGSIIGPSGTGLTYTWSIQENSTLPVTIVSGSTATINNVVVGTYTITLTCNTTYSGNPYTNSETIYVNVNARPTTPTITAGGSTTFCSGGSVTLTSTAGTSYLWSTGATTQSISVSTSGNYTVQVTNANGCLSDFSTATAVTVNPNWPASVSIWASPAGAICAGTSVTFTATPTNGGTTPAYQWKLNGTNVGSNSTTYTNAALANGDVVTCEMTSNATCATGSPATSSGITMTVNPSLPASVSIGASPAGAICAGTSVTFTATPTNGGTTPSYQWKLNGTNVGSNSTTYTNAALANGDVVSCVMTSNATCATGSPAISNEITMTVNGIPIPPIVPTVITLGCSATSFQASWNASAMASSYRFDVATDAVFSPVAILSAYNDKDVGNVVSENVTGLSGTTFYVRVRATNSCGTSLNSSTITVLVPSTTYTLPGGWDNGAPSSANNVRAVFASDYSVTSLLEACSCQINSGVNVKVGTSGGLNADAILKIHNGLDVQGTGTLTFENNASLIQVNDNAVNIGDIIYKRVTTPMKNFDFTYWCSPVEDQLLKDLSPNTFWDKYYSFDNGGWKVKAYGNALMELAKGYIIRVPKPDAVYPNGEYWTGATYAQPVQFVGVPNNGIVTIPAQGAGMDNLIGNPYPSAIDARLFITTNSALIGGALQFWTHNTAIAPSGSFYVYDPGDYASFNLTGGTKATTGGVTPNGKIAAGQSFFVVSNSDNNFVFNNSMRNTEDVLASGSNSQFFRMSQTKKMVVTEENRVWLNLTNSGGAFKQLLVGYITGATNEIDNLYDGISINANMYVDFYSINNGKNLSIQGRALPFEETDQVPLGYRTTIQGDFTINIDNTDGVLSNQDIFIEDKVTGTMTNLKNGAYTFSTTTGVFNDRFILRFTPNSATTRISGKVTSDTYSVLVSVKDKQIKINSLNEIIDKVMIYDLKASLLYQKDDVNSNEFVVSNFNSTDQFLIVQVLLKNGKWVTKEIVF